MPVKTFYQKSYNECTKNPLFQKVKKIITIIKSGRFSLIASKCTNRPEVHLMLWFILLDAYVSSFEKLHQMTPTNESGIFRIQEI